MDGIALAPVLIPRVPPLFLDRLAHSVTTATFTVQLSPEQASNPFFGHCAVPFTQRGTALTPAFHAPISSCPVLISDALVCFCAALMTGRLQRFVEDQGALNFDQEVARQPPATLLHLSGTKRVVLWQVSVPLTVLYRLSPRRDAPEHGLRTVTAATMSLINNLRLLPTPQRRLTTLRCATPTARGLE